MSEEWRKYANCVGIPLDMFFLEHTKGKDQPRRMLKRVCANCEVREEYLESQLNWESSETSTSEIYGYFGGKSAIARRKILSERGETKKKQYNNSARV